MGESMEGDEAKARKGDPRWNEKPLNAVAHALWLHQVKAAREKVDKLGLGLADIGSFFLNLRDETDAALVILATSYLDTRLTDAWKKNMPGLSSSASDLLFENSGPLATMSAKIRLAHALGWLTDKTAADLHIVRKIRNYFAHDPYKQRLSDHEVTGLISSMENVEKTMIEAARNADGDLKICELTPRIRYHVRITMLTYGAIREMISGPIAIKHQVSRKAVLGEFDESPESTKAPLWDSVKTVLTIIQLS